MSRRIVITPVELNGTGLLLIGLMENQRLIEVRLDELPVGETSNAVSAGQVPDRKEDETISGHLLGNIYVGKVKSVVPNLNAAFVEIAPGMACYLSLAKADPCIFVRRSHPERIVQEDEILVQVQREAVRGKAPTLTTNLNFSGRYAVITTGNQRIGISSKLDSSARVHYTELLKDRRTRLPDGCGLIVRTNAARTRDEDLLAEIDALSKRVEQVVGHAEMHTCFSCLYRTEAMYLTYLQGAYSEGLDEIVTDLPVVYRELNTYCAGYSDLKEIPVRLYEDDSFPLISLCNLNREMMRATAREVRLNSGGFLVIDPTEAMTVIDVNTGKSSGERNRDDFFLRINREASREIALQLRLRNISGIVIIDYVNLDTDEQKRTLTEELRRLVGTDPVPVTVHDITALNLVEITRKKVEKSLAEQIKQLTMKNPL